MDREVLAKRVEDAVWRIDYHARELGNARDDLELLQQLLKKAKK